MDQFENTMQAPFKVSEAHEAFIVDHGMMKGFGPTVVDHFTFGVSSSGNKVKKVMNQWFRATSVKINGEKSFRRSEMQGRMRSLDLQSVLNGSSIGELRLTQS